MYSIYYCLWVTKIFIYIYLLYIYIIIYVEILELYFNIITFVWLGIRKMRFVFRLTIEKKFKIAFYVKL